MSTICLAQNLLTVKLPGFARKYQKLVEAELRDLADHCQGILLFLTDACGCKPFVITRKVLTLLLPCS